MRQKHIRPRVETEDDISGVAVSYEADVSGSRADVELMYNVDHKVPHLIPRVPDDVVNAA